MRLAHGSFAERDSKRLSRLAAGAHVARLEDASGIGGVDWLSKENAELDGDAGEKARDADEDVYIASRP